ncbi:oligomeric, coiled-coil, peripheral membrane protein [Rhizoclosmatium hyalinum]|nr:oligomeric, coiled-coil, peripheral membrane protein [Rhizoclosmatium hyalinum]
MAMECLTVRFEALGSMGDALAEMDKFVHRFVKESLGLQANITKLVGDEANPLKLKLSDLDSFKHAVNMASSMSNSIGEDHDFSAAADTKLSSPVELRDVYLNMIQLVDSVDISGWSDTVVRSCHNWKEMILTQSLRKAMLQGPKIAYTGFREGDLVLFLPTRNPKVWVAFNENAPHYFLSSASADTHFPTQIASKNWILAVVTNIEARKAGKPVTGMSTSQVNDIPLGLPVGTKYFWCTAVPLNK